MKRFLSSIFEEEPERWGLRGDPFLWRHLKARYAETSVPFPVEELRRDILEEFKRFCGEYPTLGGIHSAPEFAKVHVGMSTGKLAGDFWINFAIPLLCRRLERLNTVSGEKK